MTKILGLAGRRQSGKTTTLHLLVAYHLNLIGYKAHVNDKGELVVLADNDTEMGLDLFNKHPEFIKWSAETYWQFIKPYNCADLLKQMCIDILGIEHKQVYGTNEDKNSLTQYLWENMPMDNIDENGYPIKEGQMTARELLQFVGTEIFRRMNGDVWIEALLRQINYEQPEMAVIADLRFPNEVVGIQQAGGKVIRFTRNPFPDDKHESEVALDQERFDWTKFDAVIDNSSMSIEQQNEAVGEQLRKWGYIE